MEDYPISVPPGVSLLDPNSVPERSGVSATWSHVRRNGQWLLPRHFRALAMMGGVDLDLTQVVLGPGVSEIEVVAIMGSVKIVVPRGIGVQVEGDATLGKFGLMDGVDGWAPPGAPIVRITGSAYLGAVEVTILDGSERGWIAKFFDRGTT